MNQKFWIVWLPTRGLPNKQHETPESAIAEAQRIAAVEGQSVYVCECIGDASPQKSPIVWTDYDD